MAYQRHNAAVPGSNFTIEYCEDGTRLRMQPRAGYSFEVHAKAALILAGAKKKHVVWCHSEGDVSTESGATPEALRQWYDVAYTKK